MGAGTSGPSASASWQVFNDPTAPTGAVTTTDLVAVDPPGTMVLRVATTAPSCGLVQTFASPGNGLRRVKYRVELLVERGQVSIGIGAIGATGIDITNQANGAWEALATVNGLEPAEQIRVVASSSDGAEFLMRAAFVHSPPDGNLLDNSGLDEPSGTGSTRLEGAARGGPSAAARWTVWNNATAVTTTEQVPTTRPGSVGQMLRVTTSGAGCGLVQVFLTDNAGPDRVHSSAWVYVERGSVLLGTGNGGNTGSDVVSTGTNRWEFLEAMNGQAPANELIVYSQSADGADFYVDDASANANRPVRYLAVDYHYDSLDRLDAITYPALNLTEGAPRRQVHYRYDVASRVNALVVDGEQHASEIAYDATALPTSLDVGAPSGFHVLESYEYDPTTGLLRHQGLRRGGSTAVDRMLLDLSYEYIRPGPSSGTTGQLTRTVDHLDERRSRSYAYDALGRLRMVSRGHSSDPLWTQLYTFDTYGNRIDVEASGTVGGTDIPRDGIPGITYDSETNRITTPGFAYDDAGNLTRSQRSDGTTQRYLYDAVGRLVSVIDDAGANIETNVYGASRQRLMTHNHRSGTTSSYIWDRDVIIAEYDESDLWREWTRQYIYLNDRLLSTFVRSLNGSTLQYHHPDRLGTRLISDAETPAVIEVETLPFGVALAAESTGSHNHLFTSYARSAATGLDYAVNRYYDPLLGRFLQTDPREMQAVRVGLPQSNNLYTYGGGDPINTIDPTGLQTLHFELERIHWSTYYNEQLYEGDELLNATFTGSGLNGPPEMAPTQLFGNGSPGATGSRAGEGGGASAGGYAGERSARAAQRWYPQERDPRVVELARGMFQGPARPTNGLDRLALGWLGVGLLPLAGYGLMAFGPEATLTGLMPLLRSGTARMVAQATPIGSALLKTDAAHRASTFVVESIENNASVFIIRGGDAVERTLVQMPGVLNGIAGRFEWIIQDSVLMTHQFFVQGGGINGIPIKP